MKLLETSVPRRNVLAGLGASAVGIITLTACGSSSNNAAASGAKNFVMTVWGGDPDKAKKWSLSLGANIKLDKSKGDTSADKADSLDLTFKAVF